MTAQYYNWKRFWHSRDSKLQLTSDGFLYKPDVEETILLKFSPEANSFAELSSIQCLPLLGTPGSGKSHELELQYKTFKLSNPNVATLFIDLGSYDSGESLGRNIFESAEFKEWLGGSHQLYLFLDSLDEGLLNIKVIVKLLCREFDKYATQVKERLYLRITCRASDWPASLEDKFKQIWGKGKLEVYNLAPLRHSDVVQAVQTRDLDLDKFFKELTEKQIMPLATRPVTLNFLFSIFKSGKLPDTQIGLYREGCRFLCEQLEGRSVTDFVETRDAVQRMTLASRLAFITIFSNYSAISTESFAIGESGSINVRELVRAGTVIKSDKLVWNETAIKEVLKTGLFVTRKPNLYTWSHQSYAEFLAAEYLVNSEVPLRKLLKLITHAGDSKLIPQLQQTTAWLASIRKDVFNALLKIDPQTLLQSDIATNTNEDQVTLVENLLESYNQEQLLPLGWNVRTGYAKLNHPGITDQLLPYLTDVSKNEIAKTEAIRIVKDCNILQLQSSLADIIIDDTQQENVRRIAAYALLDMSVDDDVKLKLNLCLSYTETQDPMDDLRGCALELLWPEHLSASELFSILRPPRKKLYAGLYENFLSSIVPNLQSCDLPVALQWVSDLPHENLIPFRFFEIADSIMLLAWRYLFEPGVLHAFSNAAFSRFTHYAQPLSNYASYETKIAFGEESEKRLALLNYMLPALVQPQFDMIFAGYTNSTLIRSDDVPSLLKMCESTVDETVQLILARMIRLQYRRGAFSQTDLLYYTTEKIPLLKNFFGDLFVTQLDSQEAVILRNEFEANEEAVNKKPSQQPSSPSPQECVKHFLEKLEIVENKNPHYWLRLCNCLLLTPDGINWDKEYEADITKLPIWNKTDSETQVKIILAAKNHILTQTDKAEDWLNLAHRPDLTNAGYKALRLVTKVDKIFTEQLSKNVWDSWTAVIVCYPADKSFEEKFLIAKAYLNAPDKFKQTLVYQLLIEDRIGDIEVLSKLERCWDVALYELLLKQYKDEKIKLKPHTLSTILEKLVEQNYEPAVNYAIELINSHTSENKETLKTVIAACALLSKSKDASWNFIWPIINQDIEFGRAILTRFVYSDSSEYKPRIIDKLKEIEIADFYIWITRQYPHAEDPQLDGVHQVNTREEIKNYRDELLRFLKEAGSVEAYKAVEKISRELTELNGLKQILLEAKKTTRRNTWLPVSPEQILNLVNNQQQDLGSLRLQMEEIDSFKKIKTIQETDVLKFLTNGYLDLAEDAIQTALEQILVESYHKKDWGGEANDLYTNNVIVQGERVLTAFLLKGNGLKKEMMQIGDCGKNGDQILRLTESPADLYIIQFVGNVAENVIKDIEGKVKLARTQGDRAWYCIMNGKDTARLLLAYDKLDETLLGKQTTKKTLVEKQRSKRAESPTKKFDK